MRPIRAYLPSLPPQEGARIEIPNIPPSSPKNAAIYLPEVDATQPPNLSGGGDCVANKSILIRSQTEKKLNFRGVAVASVERPL